MLYIKDSLDYIEAVSFDAGIEYEGRPCTPYTGKVPANYNSLEEWSENALINAYKIINGDLVLDETRQKHLENKLAKELEDNTLATHKYVNDKVNLENNLVSDELATEKSGADFITLENTKDYSIPKINVDSTEDKEVVVTNKNLLCNDLINAGYRGVRLETNEDKSFKLDGKISDYASENFNSQETVSLKADIEVEGKAEQVHLEGYNIINWNSPLRTQSGFTTEIVNNLFKVNGTLDPTSNHIFDTSRKVNNLKLKKGTYTFSISKPLNFQIGLLFFGTTWVLLYPGETAKTFTLENDYDYFSYFSCGSNKGTGYETLNEEFYIQIVEGTVAKPYEPYCGGVPSPNLDYPQEIKTVDKIKVKVSSKNLIKDSLNYGVENLNFREIWNLSTNDNTAKDTNIVYKGMKVVNIVEDWGRRWQTVNLKNETVYTLSAYVKNNDEARTDDYVNYPSKINVYGQSDTDSKCTIINKNFNFTDSVPKEWTRIFVIFRTGNVNEFKGINKIRFEPETSDWQNHCPNIYMCGLQLEEGDTMTEYEADFPTTETELLNNEVLASLPNGIKDEIRENKIIKKIGKIVLDGSENWHIEDTQAYKRFTLIINDCVNVNKRGAVLSNYFFNMAVEKALDHSVGGAFTFYGKIFLYHNALNVEEFKKFLADKKAQGNPVIVYYELATPTEIDLPVIPVPSADAKIDITTNLATVTNSRVMEHIESIELPFKSDRDNLKMLYLLKAGKDYTLSGLNDITLNMYAYNGTDRELVYSGADGKINVATDKVITHTSLTLKYANKFTNTVIKPQLEVGAVATEYVEGKQVHHKSTLKEFKNIFRTYDGTTHIMNNKKANMKVKYFLYQTLKNTLASFKVEQDKIIGQVKESIDFTRNLKGKELEVVNALDTTIEQLKITRNENAKLLLPSTKLYPSAHLFPCTNTDSFTICIDTAPSTKPTSNIKKYNVATKIYMLVKGTVKDEVIIKTNAERTTCTVELIQRLQNVNGVITELTEPRVTKLADLPVMCLKGTNYIYVEPNGNYNNYTLDLTYIYNTELNKLFTNKTEVSSKIEQTKDAINLEVAKKVGKDEIKSAINQSAEKIKIQANNIEFEGTVTANENFKILEDGSIEAKNGSFSGNINLADGSEILGGKGLLSNLHFFGKGDSYNSDVDGFSYVGFQTLEMESRNVKTGLAFNFYIPPNFTIEKATMHLTYVPLKVNGTDAGSIKNAKLYKQSIDSGSYLGYYLQSSIINNISSYSEDTGLLKGDFNAQGELTFDITQSVIYGVNRLVIQSGNEPPPFNEMDWDGNHRNTAINSGYLSGEIYIIGYLNNSKNKGGVINEKNNI